MQSHRQRQRQRVDRGIGKASTGSIGAAVQPNTSLIKHFVRPSLNLLSLFYVFLALTYARHFFHSHFLSSFSFLYFSCRLLTARIVTRITHLICRLLGKRPVAEPRQRASKRHLATTPNSWWRRCCCRETTTAKYGYISKWLTDNCDEDVDNEEIGNKSRQIDCDCLVDASSVWDVANRLNTSNYGLSMCR